jgi:membrane protein DedA with SNARE-associated domain/rhodanese-related sulfurtransferase
MSAAYALLLQHGYLLLFFWVLVQQLGAPLPTVPLVLAAGALTAAGTKDLSACIVVVTAGCVTADAISYSLGRRYGGRLVRLLCRMSLEPAACVIQAENAVIRYGAPALLVTKFLPGINVMAAPIAGQSRMPYPRFLLFAAAGAGLWASTFLLAGRLLGDAIGRRPAVLEWVGRSGLLLVAIVLGAALLYRALRLRRYRQATLLARLTPAELKARLDAGEPLLLIDLRHPMHLDPDRGSLPGARLMSPSEVLAQKDAISRDQEIVVFCNCPGEASAVALAVKLRRMGILLVHPLEGGVDAWRHAGYPIEPAAPPGGLRLPRPDAALHAG